jgi:hypothetical protein
MNDPAHTRLFVVVVGVRDAGCQVGGTLRLEAHSDAGSPSDLFGTVADGEVKRAETIHDQ